MFRNAVKFSLCAIAAASFCLTKINGQEYLSNAGPTVTDVKDVRSPLSQLTPSKDRVPEMKKGIFETADEAFIAETEIMLKPRFYYLWRDNGDSTHLESAAIGGSIGLRSGYYKDFLRVGLTGHTSQHLSGSDSRDGANLLQAGQESYSVLGEAYLELKHERSAFRGGFQQLDIPYINANDSRMVPNSFEAYLFGSNWGENIRYGGVHVRRIRSQTSSDFETLAERAGTDVSTDGLSLFGLGYAEEDRFGIGAVTQVAWDMYNTVYAEAFHFFDFFEERTLRLTFQFTDQRSIGKELLGEFDVQHFGVKASSSLNDLLLSTSVTYTSKGGNLRKPFGGSPSFNSILLSDMDRPGELSWRGTAAVDLDRLGLKEVSFSLTTAMGNTPDSGADASPDQFEYNLNLDYRPEEGLLENLWLRLRWGENFRDSDLGGRDISDFRIIANYSIDF